MPQRFAAARIPVSRYPSPTVVRVGGGARYHRVGFLPGLLTAVGSAASSGLLAKKPSRDAVATAERPQNIATLNDWRAVMGKIPGREIGISTLRSIFMGAIDEGYFPQGKAAWANDAIFGCSRCGETMQGVTKKALAAGVGNPATILDQYWVPAVQKTHGVKWCLPNNAIARQILTDIFDALVFQEKPGAPLYYGQPLNLQPAPVATPAPAAPVSAPTPPAPPSALPPPVTPAPVPPVATVQPVAPVPPPPTAPAPAPAPVTLPATPATPTTAAAPPIVVNVPSTVPPDKTGELIQALLSQGASQQQAFTQAMNSLAAQGVPPTPQVQAAVTEQVQKAASGPSPAMIVGILAATGLTAWAVMKGRKSRR